MCHLSGLFPGVCTSSSAGSDCGESCVVFHCVVSSTTSPIDLIRCKVCLKQWNLDYHSMLCLLGLPPLTIRHKHLKLVTMYNIISGNMYFPSGHFVYYTSPYSTRNCNFIRPFSRLSYMYHSFCTQCY